MIIQTASVPTLDLNNLVVPSIRIKNIHLQNYKVFEDVCFSFEQGKEVQTFSCFYGPNGCGKTTILDAIQLLFSKLDGYETSRVRASLGKAVRNVDGVNNAIFEGNKNNFLISAEIETDHPDYPHYVVKIDKSGFISDHPQEIKNLAYRLCFSARFDQDLHKFQLERGQWDRFKFLFESVTGFEVEEHQNLFFSEEADPAMNKVMEKYVLNFIVKKPNEVIGHQECSAGEKKIIKCFSTILNQEIEPEIILIDNVAMHVESGRHIDLIHAIKKCFQNSQIFSTTHSYHISRNFGTRSQLYDLRIIRAEKILRDEPWRFHMIDEAKDMLIKLASLDISDDTKNTYKECGKTLICILENDELLEMKKKELCDKFKQFLSEIESLYVDDVIMHTFTQIQL